MIGGRKRGVLSPYVAPEEALEAKLSARGWVLTLPTQRSIDPDASFGEFYSLEPLVYLLVRRNWRKLIAQLWPHIAECSYRRFEPANSWGMFLWHNEAGQYQETQPSTPQSWAALKVAAHTVDETSIPALFVNKPHLLLLTLMVYPHRINPNWVTWLDARYAKPWWGPDPL